MTPVGFEPTQLALVELESTPLDHSGKVSWKYSTSYFKLHWVESAWLRNQACTPLRLQTDDHVDESGASARSHVSSSDCQLVRVANCKRSVLS